jgi:PilZ domain
VLIGGGEFLPALKDRVREPGELLAFTDAEALRALEIILTQQPNVVALERLFAATPRGAALINRIKADPALGDTEIRIIAHDSDYSRVSARLRSLTEEPTVILTIEEPPDPQTLDQRGTRRAQRFKVAGTFGTLLDGNAATVIDISPIGAQVVSSIMLKPNQVVRMAISDDHDSLRFNAAVAWASFEIPPNSGPRYRAGIKFMDADQGALGGFCRRHKS